MKYFMLSLITFNLVLLAFNVALVVAGFYSAVTIISIASNILAAAVCFDVYKGQ